MKLKCEKEILGQAIISVVNGASNKTTMPILQGVLIQTNDNSLKLTTYDLEVGIEYIFECDVEKQGATVVDARMFSEIIRKLPSTQISIELNEANLLVIECEGSLYKLATMNAEEFPELPQIDIEKHITIKQHILKDMIRKTIFAVSTEESKQIFTGCLFEVINNTFNIVAVDGFRLALRKVMLEQEFNDFSAVIPGKTLGEVNKIVSDTENEIEIGISKNQALFQMENCKIVTRLLEGEFLNYKNVIPKDKTTRAIANKNTLLRAFERISLLSANALEKERKYPVKMNIALEQIKISCTSQTGDAKEEITARVEGEELEIGFNPKYFQDALRAIDDEEVCMDFGSNISPAIVRPIDGESYTYMILPIRLKD